jgi:hypothetical protein
MSTSGRRALTDQLLVRMPALIASYVRSLAAAEDITAAAWCRRHLAVAAGAPAESTAPVRAYRAPLPPVPAHVIEIARLRESVAELAGALVQAAIRTKAGGHQDTHAAIEAALPGVRAAVMDLDALKLAAMRGSR